MFHEVAEPGQDGRMAEQLPRVDEVNVDGVNVADLRVSYDEGELLEADLASTPLAQFRLWFAEAYRLNLPEPNAMVLATSIDDQPSGRTVLLKGVDARGFTFFSNHQSRKGRELSANPHASLVFPWFAMHRQVVVVGDVALLSRDEVNEYFDSRPLGSRVGAWASPQSAPIEDRAELERRYSEAMRKFDDGEHVSAPQHWGGYLVIPRTVEFWQGRPSRMHDRLVFVRTHAEAALDDADGWAVQRLAP